MPAPNPAPEPAPSGDPLPTPPEPAPAPPAGEPNPAPAPEPDAKPVDIKAGALGDPKPAPEPTNWREPFMPTKEEDPDGKIAAHLGRYTTQAEFAKSVRELRAKISSGEAANAPKPDGDVQQAAWREQRGIPLKPDGYTETLGLPDGMVLNDADKDIVSQVSEAAFGADVPAEQMSAMANAFFEARDAEEGRRHELNEEAMAKAEVELTQEHGHDVKNTKTRAVNGMVNLFGEENAKLLSQAILPDGTGVFSHAIFVNGFDQAMRHANPAATVIPGGLGTSSDVASRIAEIQKVMNDDRKTYDGDQAMQDEFANLLAARDEMK